MRTIPVIAWVGFALAPGFGGAAAAGRGDGAFADTVAVDKNDFGPTGVNRYFVLVPGPELVLEGQEDGRKTVLTILVRDERKVIDGVTTRVIEGRETAAGQLVEVSRNYFAISRRTGDVFYFGEELDIYKEVGIASHEGAWLSGVGGARFGLMMPGAPRVGLRYPQEVAPGVATDRTEMVSLTATRATPAGKFARCLQTAESSPLERGKSSKFYAENVGLMVDGELKFVRPAAS